MDDAAIVARLRVAAESLAATKIEDCDDYAALDDIADTCTDVARRCTERMGQVLWAKLRST